MKILAIDPSLNGNGICIHGQTERIGAGKLTGTKRLWSLKAAMLDVLQTHQPDLVVLEDYAFGASGRATMSLAEWGGILRLMLHEMAFPVALVSPNSLKSWATGKGNAKKDAVVSEITNRSGQTFRSSDEADAWALWAMASQRYGQPVVKMPADRAKALEKIDWPEIVDKTTK